jgi:hypothetical protein
MCACNLYDRPARNISAPSEISKEVIISRWRSSHCAGRSFLEHPNHRCRAPRSLMLLIVRYLCVALAILDHDFSCLNGVGGVQSLWSITSFVVSRQKPSDIIGVMGFSAELSLLWWLHRSFFCCAICISKSFRWPRPTSAGLTRHSL